MNPPTPAERLTKSQIIALVLWLAVTFAASASAIFVSTDGWYAELHKPSWNPPSWVFGPAWTLLYVIMGVAAWLVWCEGGWAAQKHPLRLYLIQLFLNALWTPLFFGLHHPGIAFGEILILWLAVLSTLVAFWQVRRVAGWLMVPYLAWVSFATALNYQVWALNS